MALPGACVGDQCTREERERLILEHLPHVKWVARRVHQSIQGRVDLDDLISAGVIGLIAAIDRFDPARELQLKTYAEHKIRGAIMDSLRSVDALSREERRRTKETRVVRSGLEHRLQRTATHTEVAEEMGLTPSQYAKTITAPGANAPFPLDAKVHQADGVRKFADIMPDSADSRRKKSSQRRRSEIPFPAPSVRSMRKPRA
ncbi:hypothetical protein SBA3_1510033 [Candidatus Sulfopaludibacter sp. SbA3]|nr:hypothetical protein SBA3_1510033 [Candidatus Sulfopaludibacter sp. SbA3]